MKKILTLIALIAISYTTKAQYDSLETKAFRLNVMIDAIQSFNPVDPSLMISSEVFLSERLSLAPEVGIMGTARSNTSEERPIEVKKFIKLQQSVRYYFDDFEDENIKLYVGATIQYRNMTINENYIIGYDCPTFGGCLYYRNFTGDISTERLSYTLNFGARARISDRLLLNWSYGIGEQNYTVDRAPFFEGTFVENDRFIEEEKLGRNIFMSFSIKLGYWIFK
ncbi:MAG: hypothetical protein RIA69_02320 [Cyclobacteriaceae bacterium]